MRALITGAGGFVGTRLAAYLLSQAVRVSGTWFEEHKEVPGVELFEADLLDLPALERVVRATSPDVIVNLAGLSHVGESWRRMPDYFRVNVLGTENLLTAAAGRRVVIASSAEVYGAVPEEEQPIAEERRLDPRTPYALTKAAAERIALQRGAVVVRSFNLVGPGQSESFALPAFASQLAAIARGEREPVLRVGNLSTRRDFVHVDDGAAAYLLIALHARPGEVYNIASGQAHGLREALDLLMEIAGVSARVESDPGRMRPVDMPLLLGDASRLRALGWKPTRDLAAALADLWAAVAAAPAPLGPRSRHPL